MWKAQERINENRFVVHFLDKSPESIIVNILRVACLSVSLFGSFETNGKERKGETNWYFLYCNEWKIAKIILITFNVFGVRLIVWIVLELKKSFIKDLNSPWMLYMENIIKIMKWQKDSWLRFTTTYSISHRITIISNCAIHVMARLAWPVWQITKPTIKWNVYIYIIYSPVTAAEIRAKRIRHFW